MNMLQYVRNLFKEDEKPKPKSVYQEAREKKLACLEEQVSKKENETVQEVRDKLESLKPELVEYAAESGKDSKHILNTSDQCHARDVAFSGNYRKWLASKPRLCSKLKAMVDDVNESGYPARVFYREHDRYDYRSCSVGIDLS